MPPSPDLSNQEARVLIVDDERRNRQLLEVMLAAEGFIIVTASSGEEALAMVAERAPDLILLDIMLPGMNGYELTGRIKGDDATKNIPVIMVTSLDDRSAKMLGLRAGAEDFLTKPVDRAELCARVRNLLRLKAYGDYYKRNEQALQLANLELTSAKAAAQEANLAKSDFLSSMSHELRSPLNAILGFAQLMESDTPAPTAGQQESIGQILRAGWHLLMLINEILDLAKIESGKLSLSLESVSLAEVMVECRGMVEGAAQKRGIRLIFPEFDLPCFVHTDRTRLKQVLINFLTNAIKYNSEQGTVGVACSVSAPGRIRVSVSDTGGGMPAESLAQLFQPFNRLGQEFSGEEGAGIGLVVAKQLIELMGGVISVESTVGVGSVFWFELPAGAVPQTVLTSEKLRAPAASEDQSPKRKRLLLYVEDNPANLKLVQQIVARRPELRLLTAMTGNLGVELARVHQPDVILMDINLPDISGIEALRVLRDDPTTAHIPVVAVSASAMPHDIERGIQAGFLRYLTKPINVSEFMETLNKALLFAELGVRP